MHDLSACQTEILSFLGVYKLHSIKAHLLRADIFVLERNTSHMIVCVWSCDHYTNPHVLYSWLWVLLPWFSLTLDNTKKQQQLESSFAKFNSFVLSLQWLSLKSPRSLFVPPQELLNNMLVVSICLKSLTFKTSSWDELHTPLSPFCGLDLMFSLHFLVASDNRLEVDSTSYCRRFPVFHFFSQELTWMSSGPAQNIPLYAQLSTNKKTE